MLRREMLGALGFLVVEPIAALASDQDSANRTAALDVSRQHISPRQYLPVMSFPAGDYTLAVRGEGYPDLRYLYATLSPNDAGQYYPSSVMERLRAAGLIEPNNPETNFFSTRSMLPWDGAPGNDAFFRVITFRAFGRAFRIESEAFLFLVNSELVVGDGVSAASFSLEPQDKVSVMLYPGATGRFL